MRAVKKVIERVTRWAIGVALFPVLWSLGHRLSEMAPLVAAEGVRSWWLYAAGALSYLVLERVTARPMWLYVVGHELTHAASGLLSGARIYSLRAGSHGGEVELSKSNGFIALSPYVVPFYTVLVIGLYAAARKWWNPPWVYPTFQLLLGVSLAFHFSHTWSALHSRQTDLKIMGFFLSGVLVALGNILILGLLGVSLFTRTPTLRVFAVKTARETGMIWTKGLKICRSEVKRFNPASPAGASQPKDFR